MLVLADREFLGVPLWRAFTAAGAHVVWRVSANRVLPVQARRADGSWLSRIHACTDGRKRDPVRVRVIAYGLDAHDAEYRLVTDLLDADRFPAKELAALYCQRWEIESVFGEIKTQQRGSRVVLSSKTPDGVLQRIWAHLLVHHALRALIRRTATTRGTGPNPTGSPSPTPCDQPAAASPQHQAFFPPEQLIPHSLSSATTSCPSSCPHDGYGRNLAWSNARCPTTTSNALNTGAGSSRPRHRRGHHHLVPMSPRWRRVTDFHLLSLTTAGRQERE